MSELDASTSIEVNATIVEAIAQRVAELLRLELGLTTQLLTPTDVARKFAVSRTWVYEHAAELGAIRLGEGPKARLRFDAKTVSEVLDRQPKRTPRPPEPRGRRGRTRQGALLPVDGFADPR